MAEQQSVQVSWDAQAGKLKAEPERLKILKGSKDLRILWTPGFDVESVNDIEFVGDTDDQFSGKVKNDDDGTVSIKDKNSKKAANPKGYKYKIKATNRDGAGKELDPFVENDPKR